MTGLSSGTGRKKKKRDVTRSVTLFRVLPRATSEAPILPCPRPIYILIFPSPSVCLYPSSRLASPSPQLTVSILRDFLSQRLLTLSPDTRPSVYHQSFLDGLKFFSRTHQASPSSSSSISHFHPYSPLYPCVQLASSLSLLPPSLFRHSRSES